MEIEWVNDCGILLSIPDIHFCSCFATVYSSVSNRKTDASEALGETMLHLWYFNAGYILPQYKHLAYKINIFQHVLKPIQTVQNRLIVVVKMKES